MAKNNIKVRAKVFGVQYKSTSYYGNPSYWVTFETDNGVLTAYTATDAACGYGCRNYLGGSAEITYHRTRTGNYIIDYMAK